MWGNINDIWARWRGWGLGRSKKTKFQNIKPVHPGKVLQDELEEIGVTQIGLAEQAIQLPAALAI